MLVRLWFGVAIAVICGLVGSWSITDRYSRGGRDMHFILFTLFTIIFGVFIFGG